MVSQSTDSWTVSVSPTLACIGTTSTAYKTLHGKSWLQSFPFSRVGAGARAEKLRFKCLLVVAAVSFKADTLASYLFFVVKYMFFKIRVLVPFKCNFSHFRQYVTLTTDSYYQYSPSSRQALIVTNTTYRVHSWDDHNFLNELLGTTSTLGIFCFIWWLDFLHWVWGLFVFSLENGYSDSSRHSCFSRQSPPSQDAFFCVTRGWHFLFNGRPNWLGCFVLMMCNGPPVDGRLLYQEGCQAFYTNQFA